MNKEEQLDVEWLKLMLMARELGLTIDQIREYINNSSEKQKAAIQG